MVIIIKITVNAFSCPEEHKNEKNHAVIWYSIKWDCKKIQTLGKENILIII